MLACGVWYVARHGMSQIPAVATGPILVLVGAMMMAESAKINWESMVCDMCACDENNMDVSSYAFVSTMCP